MSVPTVAIAAVPVTVLAMAQTVQSVGQASSVLGYDPSEAATRLRKAEMVVAALLVAAAVASGSREAVVATAVAAAASYAVFDWLILK